MIVARPNVSPGANTVAHRSEGERAQAAGTNANTNAKAWVTRSSDTTTLGTSRSEDRTQAVITTACHRIKPAVYRLLCLSSTFAASALAWGACSGSALDSGEPGDAGGDPGGQDPAALAITIPVDGQVLSTADDCAPEVEGLQITVEATTQLAVGAMVALQVGTTVPVRVPAVDFEGTTKALTCLDVGEGRAVEVRATADDPGSGEVLSSAVTVQVDTVAPTAVLGDLAFAPDPEEHRAGVGQFTWTAVADTDGVPLARYELRCADNPIVTESDWQAAELASFSVTIEADGTAQQGRYERPFGIERYCQLRGFDVADQPTVLPAEGELGAGGVRTTSFFSTTMPFAAENAAQIIDVVALGDVSGDGRDDFAVSTVLTDGAARVWLYFGTEDPSAKTGPDVVLTGISNGARRPNVAPAGDFTGDGLGDIVIGEPDYNGDAGRVYIVRGRDTGTEVWPTAIDLSPAVCAASYCFSHNRPLTFSFGLSVRGVGDFDGDGRDDVAVGAPFTDLDFGTFAAPGRMFVFRGASSATLDAFGTTYVVGGSPSPSGFELTNPSFGNAPDVRPALRFGWSLAGVDDTNGDGRVEVVASALGDFPGFGDDPDNPTASTLWQIDGRAYVGPGLDVVGDGLTFVDSGDPDDLGDVLAAVGDYNGDGLVDFAASEGTSVGGVRVYLQNTGAFGAAPPLVISNDLTPSGPFAQRFAFFVSNGYVPFLPGYADINGDGRSDLMVASRGYRDLLSNAEIFFGSTNTSDRVRSSADYASMLPQQVDGLVPGQANYRSSGLIGDYNGDGAPDFGVGDNTVGEDATQLVVYY